MLSLQSFRSPRRAVGLASLMLAVGLTGCGSKLNSVTGKVTYKGQPLPNGSVMFIGDNAKGDSSPIEADGTYNIKNAPLGMVKITVTTGAPGQVSGKGQMVNEGPMPDRTKMPGMPGMTEKSLTANFVEIPAKYKDATNSGLTYEVKAGSQTHDIPLSD